MKRTACFLLFVVFVFFLLAPAASAASDSTVLEVDIGIRSGDYKRLISSAAENLYRVSVSVNGGAYTGATIHIRGRTSKEIGLAIPSKRVPVALEFPYASQLSDALGNPKVKTINSYTPYRLYAEYLALQMYDFMNIPTPAHTFSFLRYNGVDSGLYLMAEDVNETFIRKNFTDHSGTLLKEFSTEQKGTVYDTKWFGPLYAYVDHGIGNFKALIRALEQGEGWEEYIDVDEFLRFFACTAATGADVSILTELSGFLLYDNGGKFVLIPWDSSEAFQGYTTRNGIDRYYLEDDGSLCPLFELIMSDPKNRETYHAYIRKIADEFLAPEKMHPYLQKIINDTAPYLRRDTSVYLNNENAASDLLSENTSAFYCLQYTLDRIHENLIGQLNGKSDVFFSHEIYESNDLPTTMDEIVAYFMKQSPMLDVDLPEKIQKAYAQWCETNRVAGFTADSESMIAFTVFSVGAGVLAVSILLPSLRGARRKRKTSEGPEEES